MARHLLSHDAALILLALSKEPAHGGLIHGQIISDTVGDFLPNTTLYRHLRALERSGHIAKIGVDTYDLTEKGRKYMRSCALQWQRLATLAYERRLLQSPPQPTQRPEPQRPRLYSE